MDNNMYANIFFCKPSVLDNGFLLSNRPFDRPVKCNPLEDAATTATKLKATLVHAADKASSIEIVVEIMESLERAATAAIE